MSWLTTNNKIISSVEDFPIGCIGFVYLIKNETSEKFYIGKKSIFSKRKKNFGKRRIAELTDKRLKKYEYIESESDWKTYTGSNKELNDDIKKGDVINRYILDFAFNKVHLTYLEVKHQFKYEVLESANSYNDNILGKFYRNVFEFKK